MVGREMGERCGRRLREVERGAGTLSIVRRFDEAGIVLTSVDVGEYLLLIEDARFKAMKAKMDRQGHCTLTTSSQLYSAQLVHYPSDRHCRHEQQNVFLVSQFFQVAWLPFVWS